MSDEGKENSTPYGSPNDDDQISLLEAFDRAVASLPLDDVARERLLALRTEIAAQEEMVGDAREMIEKLEQRDQESDLAGEPDRHIPRWRRAATPRRSWWAAAITCATSTRGWSCADLRRGSRVLVNEAYVIVGDLGFDKLGPVVRSTRCWARIDSASARSTGSNRWCCSAAICS